MTIRSKAKGTEHKLCVLVGKVVCQDNNFQAPTHIYIYSGMRQVSEWMEDGGN